MEKENKKTKECEKCQEYLNNWKKERADFLNYKKEESERLSSFAKYAKEGMILEMLPILDNIDIALNHMPEDAKEGNWAIGFTQIKKQVEDFLQREGIEEIEAIGKPFDINTMEAIEEIEGEESGIVAEVAQKGYMMNGKIIRPAKVKITK